MWGTVYDRTLIFAQDNRATVPLAGLVQPRIEPEICFQLKSRAAGDPESRRRCSTASSGSRIRSKSCNATTPSGR